MGVVTAVNDVGGRKGSLRCWGDEGREGERGVSGGQGCGRRKGWDSFVQS